MTFDADGNQLSTRTLWALMQDIAHESEVLSELIFDSAEAEAVLHEREQHMEESNLTPRQAMEIVALTGDRQQRWLEAIAAYIRSRPIDDLLTKLQELVTPSDDTEKP